MQATIAHNLEEKTRTKDVTLDESISFDSLLLPNNILKGLSECGFRKPSPIQFKAVPLGRCGFDLVMKSKSGTGKTLVFSIIALEAVNVARNHLQALILVPTREIAVQIQEVLKGIGRFIDGLIVESFIGGLPVEQDVKKAKLCHIAVGAPGRVKHLINLGALSTEFVRLFVLDEADKLMESSFQADINEIYNTLPQRKQMVASSATYPQELDTFLTNYMLSPTHVSSENETPVLLGLKQFVSVIKTTNPNVVQLMKAKNESLLEIFSKVSFTQCLVFSNYQTRAESVSNYLNQKGWHSSFISAAQSQTKRLEAVNNLKEFKNRILLSTDLTARGIDAPNVDLVVNYDMPQDAVTYLHRMGRAGRYGSSGICINLASQGDELKQLQNILGSIGATLSISILPTLNGNCDLWQLDPSGLEQICGIVSTVTNSEEIKKEVLALKQVKQGNSQPSKKKKNKKSDNKDNLSKECVKNMLNKNEQDLEEDYKQLSSLDAETLLNTSTIKLDTDTNGDGKNVETESLLHSLINGNIKLDNDDDSKKRKRVSNDSNKDLHKEKRINDNKQAIFCKNKALLTITKLISDSKTRIDIDVVNSIEEYLSFLKEEYEDINHSSVAEILAQSQENNGEAPVAENLKNRDILENIFKIGYECAVAHNNQNWSDCLPQDELIRFQQLCKEDENVISSSSEDDEEEDYEMEECTEENEETNDQNEDTALQWIPVVPNENEISSDCQDDHFTKSYEECSNVLWQTGLSFETVEDFDNWYYHWQQQLHSVRNYVQQNIYVREMSKYQQSRQVNK